MRTIDADALKEALKSNCKPELCHDYNTAWCESCCPHNDFEDLIDNAPTVEEPEIPKGEWIKDSRGDTICLNCGFECLYNEEGLYSLGRYCHHCGADMTGGTE